MLKNKIQSRKTRAVSRQRTGAGIGKDARTNIWMRFKRKQLTEQKRRVSKKPMFSDIIDQIKSHTTSDEEGGDGCHMMID